MPGRRRRALGAKGWKLARAGKGDRVACILRGGRVAPLPQGTGRGERPVRLNASGAPDAG